MNCFWNASSSRLGIIRILPIVLSVLHAVEAHGQLVKPTVKVVEHIWGFDGRVQPGHFNPLSILLDNQTEDAVEVTATLQRVQGMLNRSGGRYVEPVFLAPSARRWVMFYPYISSSYETQWVLEIDDGDRFRNEEVGSFQQPRSSMKLDVDKEDPQPQVVILDKAGSVTSRPASLKHLPENVFPPYATATSGLHSVFLDHVPDWELPRQNAFISWLKLGGRLHLVRNSRNEMPRFSGEMSVLNQPMAQFAVGSGIVIRHEIQREGITDSLVKRSVVLDVMKGPMKEIESDLEEASQAGFNMGDGATTEPSSIDELLFRRMRELTFPEHSWPLIFFLAVCYIGLIFPGCFILSKKKELHFLTTYGAIVGLSIVFSFIFLFIGRRGYGESTTLQTLAIARAEDAGHWSVFQWNTLFVTSGDKYFAQGKDQQALYSTANTMDKEDVLMSRGNDGRIQMTIPPFTSQTFVSRRRVTTNDWKLQVSSVSNTQKSLVELTVDTGPDFPGTQSDEYRVLYGRYIYELRYDEKKQRLTQLGKQQYLARFCTPRFEYQNSWPRNGTAVRDNRTESERFFDESLPQLAKRSLLDDLTNKPSEFELPLDRVRLFLYMDVPDDFSIDVSAATLNTGRVLFIKDVFINDRVAGSEPAAEK